MRVDGIVAADERCVILRLAGCVFQDTSVSRSWGQTRPKVPYQNTRTPGLKTKRCECAQISTFPKPAVSYAEVGFAVEKSAFRPELESTRFGFDQEGTRRGQTHVRQNEISTQEQGKSRTKESYLQTIASDLHSVRESSPMPRRVGWSGVEPKAVLPMFENGGRTPSKKALALRSASSAAASAGVSCASTQTSVSVVSSPLCDGFAREQNAGLPCSHRARC